MPLTRPVLRVVPSSARFPKLVTRRGRGVLSLKYLHDPVSSTGLFGQCIKQRWSGVRAQSRYSKIAGGPLLANKIIERHATCAIRQVEQFVVVFNGPSEIKVETGHHHESGPN